MIQSQSCYTKGNKAMKPADTDCGVLYMVWGNSHDHLLARSMASLRKFHPTLPIHVHRVDAMGEEVASTEMLLHKTKMAKISPFKTTLFLDADTTVLGSLDYGFEKARQFGLACCVCECPWARRYNGLKFSGDLIEYNTGVFFFTESAQPLMYMWERLARVVDSSMYFHTSSGQIAIMRHNDQASFARAVEMTGFNPFILPLNWNFRPKWHRSFFGPIKIWHDTSPPIPELVQISLNQSQTETIVSYAILD